MSETDWISIKDAVELLGVSDDTIRRRLNRDEIPSRKITTPQGFRWEVRVRLDDADVDDEPTGVDERLFDLELQLRDERIEMLEARVDELQVDRDSWRTQAETEADVRREESEQLRILIAQAQTLALPEPDPATDPDDQPGFWSRMRSRFAGSDAE